MGEIARAVFVSLALLFSVCSFRGPIFCKLSSEHELNLCVWLSTELRNFSELIIITVKSCS